MFNSKAKSDAVTIPEQIASWREEADYWFARVKTQDTQDDINWWKAEGLRRCAAQIEQCWLEFSRASIGSVRPER